MANLYICLCLDRALTLSGEKILTLSALKLVVLVKRTKRAATSMSMDFETGSLESKTMANWSWELEESVGGIVF